MTPLVVIAVLVFGALGALLRFGATMLLARFTRFPFAVLVVNVVGGALGGCLLGLFGRASLTPEWHLILLTGLAGGLTTFSTWSVETVQLIERGRWRIAAANVTLNLAVGIGAATIGYLVTR